MMMMMMMMIIIIIMIIKHRDSKIEERPCFAGLVVTPYCGLSGKKLVCGSYLFLLLLTHINPRDH